MAQGSGASKVTIEEEDPRVQQLDGEPTGDTGAVGVTERGPVGVRTLCTSPEDYVRIFGNDVANGFMSQGARGFFKEGGQRLYVVRTVHYTNIDDETTKTSAAATHTVPTGSTAPSSGSILGANVGPFALAPGDTLSISRDGAGAATATFTATAAARQNGGDGGWALANAQTLTVSIDGGPVQTIAFLSAEFVDITGALPAEVANVINAKIVGAHASVTGSGLRVTITSDRRGSGSGVNITGGTANGALGFTTGNVAGTGNVSNIAAVTVAEVKTIVEAAVSGTLVANAGGAVRISSTSTGTGSSILVQASSSADDELGFDNATHAGLAGSPVNTVRFDARYDGAYANVVTVRIADATNRDASNFDLQVLSDGRVTRTFPNLSMDPVSPRYIEAVVNDDTAGSFLILAVDLAITGSASQRRPANGTHGPLTGGDDGLVNLDDNDFIGSSVSGTGLYALDKAEEIALLAVPGMATPAIHNSMLNYCEVHREGSVFAVLDPPANQSAVEIVTYVETTASLLESSEFGEIFWPRALVLNPNRGVFGDTQTIVVPPSLYICGRKVRNDAAEGGIYEATAGTELGVITSFLGFETDEVLDVRKRDLVYPKRINPLTTGNGLPRFIDGSRTLKSTGNFPYSAERRGVIFIEQTIKRGLRFACHRNNTPALRSRVDRTVRNFLNGEMKKGAFRTMDPATAYFVDFGDGLNTDAEVFAGRLLGRVGLATNKPAEFIILRFSQDTRALEASLAG